MIIAKNLVEPDETLLDLICTLKEGSIVLAYVCQDKEAAQKANLVVQQLINE